MILLMPVSVILMGLGWVLFSTGFKKSMPIKQEAQIQRKEDKLSDHELEFAVIPPEQQYAT